MTTVNYVTLRWNDTDYRFKVVQGGYKPILTKGVNVMRTADGRKDVTMGGVYRAFQYVFAVRDPLDQGDDFATREDLELLYVQNNISGSPGALMTLVDHFGNVHDEVILAGDHVPEPASTILEGYSALHFIPVQIEVL
jgi:hypothetical protein